MDGHEILYQHVSAGVWGGGLVVDQSLSVSGEGAGSSVGDITCENGQTNTFGGGRGPNTNLRVGV